jgi:hypothetical protein
MLNSPIGIDLVIFEKKEEFLEFVGGLFPFYQLNHRLLLTNICHLQPCLPEKSVLSNLPFSLAEQKIHSHESNSIHRQVKAAYFHGKNNMQ